MKLPTRRFCRVAAFVALFAVATCVTLSTAGIEPVRLASIALSSASARFGELSATFRNWRVPDIRQPLSQTHARELHRGLDAIARDLSTIERDKLPAEVGELVSAATARVVYLREADPTTYRKVLGELRLAATEVDAAQDGAGAAASGAGKPKAGSLPDAGSGLRIVAAILASLACLALGWLWLAARQARAENGKRVVADRARAAPAIPPRSELDEMLAMIAAQAPAGSPALRRLPRA